MKLMYQIIALGLVYGVVSAGNSSASAPQLSDLDFCKRRCGYEVCAKTPGRVGACALACRDAKEETHESYNWYECDRGDDHVRRGIYPSPEGARLEHPLQKCAKACRFNVCGSNRERYKQCEGWCQDAKLGTEAHNNWGNCKQGYEAAMRGEFVPRTKR